MYVPLFVYHNIPVIYYTSLYRDINDMKLKNIVIVTLLKLAASHTSQTSLFFWNIFFPVHNVGKEFVLYSKISFIIKLYLLFLDGAVYY